MRMIVVSAECRGTLTREQASGSLFRLPHFDGNRLAPIPVPTLADIQ